MDTLNKETITERQREFVEKAEELDYKVSEYHGRNFHRGYGIVVENVINATAEIRIKVLLWDNMGLQFILYINKNRSAIG